MTSSRGEVWLVNLDPTIGSFRNFVGPERFG